ncbi:hypothetical protein [Candidatus Uabimicrobium sp. HlEnr_7]|uniref:hypothetical protein n=1 Tax=Candidatus Uabimicrobium helgolandensis TaxID=3095367 RepID=UPI0035576420
MQDFLEKYGGKELDSSKLSDYEKWSLNFFSDKNEIQDSSFEITIQLDITKADQIYRSTYAQTPGASFTAYLIWNIFGTLNKHPYLNYRFLRGKWYSFENLPLFCLVAVEGERRFGEALVENVAHANWERFCFLYRKAIEEARNGQRSTVDEDVWRIAVVVGNLYHLNFTSLRRHKDNESMAKSYFYFGARNKASDGSLSMAFYTGFDHCTCDLFLLSKFHQDYLEKITMKSNF